MNSNLESFACLWLDKYVNSTEDNQITLKQLREVINHLQTFDDGARCEEYIRQVRKEKIVLIVSGALGREFIPRIHDLPQLTTFYVFCQDKASSIGWAKNYHKANGVFVERGKLVEQIAKDQHDRNKTENGAWISVIKSGSQSLEARNATFMWFQLFIEVLLRMHHKSNDRKELIDICKKNYSGNQREIKIIEEFEKNYKPDEAIWWYTRESCFYRMMNKALRVQDFNVLFALRFFITDVAKQLKSGYEKFIRTSDNRNIIQVYRGQMIDVEELELMKNSTGEYLSMNSYLSTSQKRSIALGFARLAPSSVSLTPILFEITINPRLKTEAFADISDISYFKTESEVLIMLGALFRIDKVFENKVDQLWVARVSLASEDDFKLKEMFAYMKSDIGEETDLNSLAKILLKMGEYEQAKKCCEKMYEESQNAVGNAALCLGQSCAYLKEGEKAQRCLTESLRVKQSIFGEKHADVGLCYSWLGALQWYVIRDNREAMSSLKKAIQIQEATLPPDSLDLAFTYNQLGAICDNIDNYDLSLEYYGKSLRIREKVLPRNHPDIANTYNNMGRLYESKGDNSKALKYYEKSLEIRRKVLPPTHPNIATSEDNIRKLKKKMHH